MMFPIQIDVGFFIEVEIVNMYRVGLLCAVVRFQWRVEQRSTQQLPGPKRFELVAVSRLDSFLASKSEAALKCVHPVPTSSSAGKIGRASCREMWSSCGQ